MLDQPSTSAYPSAALSTLADKTTQPTTYVGAVLRVKPTPAAVPLILTECPIAVTRIGG